MKILNELETLEREADSAPWIYRGFQLDANGRTLVENGVYVDGKLTIFDGGYQNEKLIAKSRNALPALLKVARAARCEDRYSEFSVTNCGMYGNICDTCEALKELEAIGEEK